MLSALPPERAKKGKVVSAEEAVQVIRDGDTVATGGFVGIGFAEEIAIALEAYFLKYNKPKDSFVCLSLTIRKKDNNETNIIDS